MTCTHDGITEIAGACSRCLLEIALEPDALTPGVILNDRFRINALAGRGGMGEVYRADDLELGQVVALKFVSTDSADRLERLRAEVRLGRQVSHPNVCRIYELLEYDGRPFIVMEFIDGEDLGSLIRRAGTLPTAIAMTLGRQICAAVAAAHDRGIVHGDLKPPNVMVDAHGNARVTDFGLSTLQGQQDARVAGTPGYMAPEQLRGERSIATDIFSLGAVLSELFAGAPPTGIRDVIARCRAANPAERPASARQVLSAFPAGDLLDAALAAGDTPSPELVAAAEAIQPLPMPSAVVVLVSAIVCVVVAAAARLTNAPVPGPPATLSNVYLVLLPFVLIAGIFAVRRNIRLARVDARGAFRLAVWVFASRAIALLIDAQHVGSLAGESRIFADAMARSLFAAAQAWLGYMAVEPYIRGRRPQTIIGWRRLLDGRWRDAIVGREVLIGVATGAAMALIDYARVSGITADAPRSTVSIILHSQTRAIFYTLFGLFVLILLRRSLRPRWIGSAIWIVVAAALLMRSASMTDVALSAILAGVLLVALTKYGFLPGAVALFAFLLLGLVPPAFAAVGSAAALLAAMAAAGFALNRQAL